MGAKGGFSKASTGRFFDCSLMQLKKDIKHYVKWVQRNLEKFYGILQEVI
jgi:hypothetical protein